MKTQDKTPITGPLLKDLMDREQLRKAQIAQVIDKPAAPPDQMHDAGEGYNANFTFPQE